MKSWLVAFILLIMTPAVFAQEGLLPDFTGLMSSLKQGAAVRAVIHYTRCRLIVDSVEVQAPDAIGGMELAAWEYFAPMSVRNPKAFVSSSETVLISHPRYGHVYNYVRLKIFENDSVQITARYLKPLTFEIAMDETFYGAMSNGNDERGVMLFAGKP